METIDDAMAKAAYTAYCSFRNWKSYGNKLLPRWEEVDPNIKRGWVVASRAAVAVAHGIERSPSSRRRADKLATLKTVKLMMPKMWL